MILPEKLVTLDVITKKIDLHDMKFLSFHFSPFIKSFFEKIEKNYWKENMNHIQITKKKYLESELNFE